jgi:NADH-quinone oxidoreductase subunit L
VGLSALFARVDRDAIDGLVNLVGTAGRAFGRLQGWIDDRAVDGAVNFVGSTAQLGGRSLRRLQSGRIQSYVFALTAGAVILVVIGYWLVR